MDSSRQNEPRRSADRVQNRGKIKWPGFREKRSIAMQDSIASARSPSKGRGLANGERAAGHLSTHPRGGERGRRHPAFEQDALWLTAFERPGA